MNDERYYFHDSERGSGDASEGADRTESPDVQEIGFGVPGDMPGMDSGDLSDRAGADSGNPYEENAEEDREGRRDYDRKYMDFDDEDDCFDDEEMMSLKESFQVLFGREYFPLNLIALLLVAGMVWAAVHYGSKAIDAVQGYFSPETEAVEDRLILEDAGNTAETDGAEAGEGTKVMVLDVSDIVAEAMPSVVAITNRSVQEVQYWFETMEIENESSGSGFIIADTEEELLIATNAHVIDGASSLTVCFTVEDPGEDPENAVVEAVAKGVDERFDLAVVAVNASDIPADIRSQLTTARIGSSEGLRIGEPAVAIGNALGYGQSATMGIISAVDREVTIDGSTNLLIQTDAAINFGNSGGVLLDGEGRVIGINSAKAAANGVEGMGYAIPIDTARPILENLMNKTTRKKVEADRIGYLGISPRDISDEGRSLYYMPEGVFVYDVSAGSPAEAAGIRRGDIITVFDGTFVGSSEKLAELLEYYSAGETVEVELQTVSDGTYTARTVTVTLG